MLTTRTKKKKKKKRKKRKRKRKSDAFRYLGCTETMTAPRTEARPSHLRPTLSSSA
jgi:hypothetical protein